MTAYGRTRIPGLIDPAALPFDYTRVVLDLGPVAYWPLQESSGTTMVAQVGSNGSYANGPTLAAAGPSAAKLPNAVSFDGSNDSASASVNLSSYADITVTFWLWWNSYATGDKQAMEHSANYNSNTGFVVNPDWSGGGGKMAVGMSNASGGGNRNLTFTQPSAAAWHHFGIKFSRTNNTISVLIDGAAASNTGYPVASTITGNFGNTSLFLASRNGASAFGACRLSHVAIFGSLLSDAQIQSLYTLAS